MEKEQRNRLQKATQDARKLLEEEYRSQLLQTYDIDVEKVRWAEEPGAHLQAEQRLIRDKLVAWIEHKEAQIHDRKEALLLALREMAFTALNRFVALKLMEARELVRPCVSGRLESAGFLEFTAVAQGLLADQESSYRLYLETIFEDVSRELRALFDPRDPASLLWPKRAALLELLEILNRPELAELWIEDETLGWVYQYFNGDAERKKMREESSAPRNSRELAVRNQFFTPRYVVEFLTDNTLGRIWYEMRQGNTGLKDRCRYLVRRPNEVWLQPGEEPPEQADADEALSQEELLRQPVHISHRPLKDPREIRMLDPACGSMHFGLYAFDLYLEIYKESWEIAQGSDGQFKEEEAFSLFVTYAAGFADKAAFLREVPRLILQYNIHGIDIDPRATQIARLTLWLRAQRAWQEQKVEVVARPAISRSNVICAEPMPGERGLLADFVDEQFQEAERGLMQQLLESVFDKMQLAGEAGSLLKIEEEIHDAIEQARKEWQKLEVQQRNLFSPAELGKLGQVGSSISTDLQNLTKDLWTGIEERIFTALRQYAEQAEASVSYQRKLFAEDAAQGFAFIDACRKRYEVALMNPPFGLASSSAKTFIKNAYTEDWNDLFNAFIRHATSFLSPNGFLGAVVPNRLLYAKKSSAIRRYLYLHCPLTALIDAGRDVMDDAAVDAMFLTATKTSPVEGISCPSLCLTAIEPDRRPQDLWDWCNSPTGFIKFSVFNNVPGTPFAYSAPTEYLQLWSEGLHLDPDLAVVATGGKTFDDFRFLRLRWEVPPVELGQTWSSVDTGGDYQPWLSPSPFVQKWLDNGSEVRAFARARHGTDAQVMQSSKLWWQPGLSYPLTSSIGFGPRIFPSGTILSADSIAIKPKRQEHCLSLLSILTSSWCSELLACFGEHRRNENSIVKSLPVRYLEEDSFAELATIAVSAINAIYNLERLRETSAFFSHYLISELALSTDQILKSCLEKASSFAKKAFGLPEHLEPETDNTALIRHFALQESFEEQVSALVSYAFGISFGRWDVRSTLEKSDSSGDYNPFSPLPTYPSGQLLVDGLAILGECQPLDKYPLEIARSEILVDDPGHCCDVTLRVFNAIAWLLPLCVSSVEGRVICEEPRLAGYAGLREWLRGSSNFFANHLRRYSKSRRQAPIYWQLSCGSGSYSAWLYYHRFSQDTLYRVLRDFVEPRIQQAEREQFELESQGVLSGDTATRLQDGQTLLQDLRILKTELDLVAPLWNPNLNDGVIINHAILWRITPYTPWQKKCKECWDKLVKGDYDWAHLAFHLWPERVIPKCTTDRSLAIAHGLEERLWQETNNGNWLPRQLSEADLQALIAEHSNPAVKSALERFLAAPPPVAPTRTRASRSTRASGSSTPRRARGSAAVVDAEATRQVLLALSAAPSDGLAKAAIADLIGVEANALTAVIKQLKATDQIEQLGAAKGTKYRLTEQGRAAVASQAGEDD